jgi:hypothetical protein
MALTLAKLSLEVVSGLLTGGDTLIQLIITSLWSTEHGASISSANPKLFQSVSQSYVRSPHH